MRFDFDKISFEPKAHPPLAEVTFFLGKKVTPSTVSGNYEILFDDVNNPKRETEKIFEFKLRECCPFLCSSKEMDERKDAEIERTCLYSSRMPKFSARREYRLIKGC